MESKGKTYWKFNNSLLTNFDFIKEVKSVILKVKETYAAFPYDRGKINEIDNEFFESIINPQLFLDMLLLELRGKSIAFSAAIRKKEREREACIENQINQLENSIDTDLDKISELKEELRENREKKLKGVLIRSRARWIEQGEKASRYFCKLENRNFVSKRMTSIINDNNVELFNQDDIRNEVLFFYKNLYSSKEENIQDVNLNLLLNDNTPKQ